MEKHLSKAEPPSLDETNKLNLRITVSFLLAQFALMLCTGELHEQVHIQTGRIVCGGYGERDFNVWSNAADCAAPAWSFLSTLAGPLFSFAVMWTGVYLLVKAKSQIRKTIGFSLIFAALPFARIFTALMGGGDEKVVFKRFLENDLNLPTIKILAAIAVTAFCLPPILIALKYLRNRYAVLYIVGFSVLPLFVLGFYVFKFLNPLLEYGLLSSVFVLGTPSLILVHSALMLVLLLFFSRRFFKAGFK